MYKNIINLYVPSWIPCAENKQIISPILNHVNNWHYFTWDLKVQENNATETIILIESLSHQLLNYFEKLSEGTKINLFINSFSQFCLMQIYDLIADKINKLILINPFDKQLYYKFFSIKKHFLVNSSTQAIYKYMYLSQSMNNFRNNHEWIKAIRNEVKIFKSDNLVYHKIFDQILNHQKIKEYLIWLTIYRTKINIITSKNNPISSYINDDDSNYHHLYLIDDCGFCLWLEKPLELAQIIEDIINEK